MEYLQRCYEEDVHVQVPSPRKTAEDGLVGHQKGSSDRSSKEQGADKEVKKTWKIRERDCEDQDQAKTETGTGTGTKTERAALSIPRARDLFSGGESTSTDKSVSDPVVRVGVGSAQLVPGHTNTDTNTDKGKGKRKRVFPHVEGNFATHVYACLKGNKVVEKKTKKKKKKKQPAGEVQQNQSLGACTDGGVGMTRTGTGTRTHMLTHAKFVSQLIKQVKQEVGVDAFPIQEEEREEGNMEGIAADAADVPVGGWGHISLSRTVAIRAGQMDTMLSLLRKKFRKFRPFECTFGDLQVLMNDDNSTCFLVLSLRQRQHHPDPDPDPGSDPPSRSSASASVSSSLDVLVDGVDHVFQRHNLQQYYSDRKHHISLAWYAPPASVVCPGTKDQHQQDQKDPCLVQTHTTHVDVCERLRGFLSELSTSWEVMRELRRKVVVVVDNVHCKIGKKITKIA